jgi:AmmeMemoRadiSam system protein B
VTGVQTCALPIFPINGLLLAARAHQLKPQLLDLRNSGDTAGDRSRVVGYAAFAFSREDSHARH